MADTPTRTVFGSGGHCRTSTIYMIKSLADAGRSGGPS
jgi:hypothetical protein